MRGNKLTAIDPQDRVKCRSRNGKVDPGHVVITWDADDEE